MKHITALLAKGNLTPKERVQLWIANCMSKEKEGKEMLTEADKYALVKGWTPKDNNEIREYNKWNDGWTLMSYARLDAQTIYLNATIDILNASRILDYVIGKDDEKLIKAGNRMFGDLDADEDKALDLLLANTGFDLNRLIHRYVFENAGEDVTRDILALDPVARYESQYLDQEEELAHCFNGKKTLVREDKEKIADSLLATLFNAYAAFVRAKGMDAEDWKFDGFYAELPAFAILEKWAKDHKISCVISDGELDNAEQEQANAKTAIALIAGDASLSKELRKKELRKKILIGKLNAYAETHDGDIRMMLKETILAWLDEGLFVKEYTAICLSNEKHTCNDVDTKLPHKQVLALWLEEKEKAKKTIQKLIDEGTLAVEERKRTLLGVTDIMHIVTGESLFHAESDMPFVLDFRKQIEDFLPLARLILFLRENSFVEAYGILMEFSHIFKKISVAYEIEIGEKVYDYASRLKDQIMRMNQLIEFASDTFESAVYHKYQTAHHLYLCINDMTHSLEPMDAAGDETITHYREEFKKILGNEW